MAQPGRCYQSWHGMGYCGLLWRRPSIAETLPLSWGKPLKMFYKIITKNWSWNPVSMTLFFIIHSRQGFVQYLFLGNCDFVNDITQADSLLSPSPLSYLKRSMIVWYTIKQFQFLLAIYLAQQNNWRLSIFSAFKWRFISIVKPNSFGKIIGKALNKVTVESIILRILLWSYGHFQLCVPGLLVTTLHQY